jgi:peptide/nickel transport system substrate-binding protein
MSKSKIYAAILSLIVITVLVLTGCAGTTSSTPNAPAQTSASTPSAVPTETVQTVGPRPGPSSTGAAPTTSAPATTTTTSGGQVYGGTMVQIVPHQPVQFGWTPTFAADEVIGATPVVEALISYTPSGQPVPKLATSWDVDPNGKFITFKLRNDVKFSDGTDFNAEAVKYNLDLELKLRPGELPGVTSVDTIDDYTVRVNLDYFSNNIWDRLGSRGLISSPKHLAEGEDACKFDPVGTGPFLFDSYKPDTFIKYTKNPNYWQKGKPYLDGLEILFIPDPMTAEATIRAGQADAYQNPDFKTAYDLVKMGYNSASLPALICGFAPDTKNPDSKFKDVRVREALEYAIDRNALVKTLGYGYLTPRTQFIPPGYLGYDESLNRPYDPAKAKELLKEAGYPDGFSTTIIGDVSFVSTDIMTAVQAYLAAVGINAKVDMADPARYADWRRQSGWTDALMFMRNGGFPWPPNLASFILDANRNDYHSMARPAGCQDLLDKLLKATEPDQQEALAKQLEKMLFDNATFLPLYTYNQAYISAPYVHDTGQMKTIIVEWTPEDAWMSPH